MAYPDEKYEALRASPPRGGQPARWQAALVHPMGVSSTTRESMTAESSGDVFDVKQIRRLIELMKKHDLSEIDLK